MSALSPAFVGLFTRHALAEMLANTVAEARVIDPNEANRRLAGALGDARLISQLQVAIWNGLADARTRLNDAALIELCQKKLDKARQFRAFKMKRADEAVFGAFLIACDRAANVASGEALDLLESPEGQKALGKAVTLVGAALAAAILK